ncbi:MAG: serine hydrolase [Pseudomonadota bacterium]
MNKLIPVLATLAVAVSPTAQAQSAQEQLDSRLRAVEAIIDAQLARESVPGAAMGIVHDQQLVWSHQFGVESLRTKRDVTDDTAFSICSVSKLFNGIAAMSLVDTGAMDLDASLYDYIGDVAPGDNTGADEPVTLRNVLSHVSGLPREGVEDFWAGTTFPDVAALRDTTQRHDQLYAPYDHWQYSNLGMALIGDAIGEVSGQAWGDYVSATILEPLGMVNTTTDMPFDRVGRGFARGYYVRDAKGRRKPVEEHQFRAYAPAAGVASSVNDLARFASWHFRLREAGGQEILKASTLRQMMRVHWVGAEFDEPGWGLAYATRRYGDTTLWGHGGYCPGARTSFTMRLPDETAYIMMVTANDVAPGAHMHWVFDFMNGAVTSVYGEDADDAASDDDASADVDLSEYEGYYGVENYDWDVYIGLDDGALFAIPVYDRNPANGVDLFVHDDGDVFRYKRDDGSLGEPVIFERDDAGNIVSVTRHSYRYTRVD